MGRGSGQGVRLALLSLLSRGRRTEASSVGPLRPAEKVARRGATLRQNTVAWGLCALRICRPRGNATGKSSLSPSTLQFLEGRNMKISAGTESFRIAVLAFLLVVCAVLIYYSHFILRTEIVFTHLFYIPIILAGLWWSRKGIVVAVSLLIRRLCSEI